MVELENKGDSDKPETWFIEKNELVKGYSIALTKDNVLFHEKSEFQDIEVFENRLFGRVMLLDDMIMVTDLDEFVYHDMITHTPMCVKPDAKKILVIGAGDGGVVRELVKYPGIEHIDMVEIDKMVCDAAREFFPTISRELDNDRVHLKFQDGVKFAKDAPDSEYDIIIIDSTDPVSVGEGLFTKEFYSDCYRILRDEGILINQSEAPFVLPDVVKGIHRKLSSIFPVFRHYMGIIPTYPSSLWLFGFASKKLDPVKDMKPDEWNQLGLKTRYYSTDLHKASFVLPAFVNDMLDSSKEDEDKKA
ncbi:polyamine aminopropyltransferase [Candidatus Woesearchaeota archaeon]|nr:polyamine aminopropyltransferase [Candidatus Woesearchaeota archaeon]